jgi:hypothetical protein
MGARLIELTNYPGYALTDDYKIWSHKSGRILKGTTIKTGYVQLRLNGIDTSIHQIVAEHFHGPCPSGHEVNHKSADKSDNSPQNLEYVTHKKNMEHLWHSTDVPEAHRKQIRKNISLSWSDERREKHSKFMSERNKQTWAQPETRKKRVEGISAAKLGAVS